MARKQAEKQKEEQFNTPEERVNLKEVAKILKTEPTFQILPKDVNNSISGKIE